jgi:predicted ribosome quality control (RQC) complex YloA/Tae2 family protein
MAQAAAKRYITRVTGAPSAAPIPSVSPLDVARQGLFSKIDREDARLVRRVKAVLGDLARAHEAEALAEAARAFVAEAARSTRGTKSLTAIDWSSGEPVTRELTLDPAKHPREQVEAIFAEARRLKRGSVVAHARIDEAHRKRARLSLLRALAATAATESDLTRACEDVHREDPSLLPGIRPPPPPRKKAHGSGDAPTRLPYRTFLSASGTRVLVGRGAKDNDELTLHVARPRDLWLHAKAQAGAHVVVPLPKGRDATAEQLIDAAHLAAHFSDARGEAIVDVTYVARRYVRKPRGSPPGLVAVDREKVLVLRIEAERLATLLAREES